VFSDTILVYNKEDPKNDGDRKYTVWYAIEFAEDLHHRLIGTGTFFRAVLTHGEFEHYDLENIECFFGRALVNSYDSEKKLPAIGLFIDDKCQQYNEYFPISPFIPGRSFVYLNRSLDRLQEVSSGVFPVDLIYIDSSWEFPFILWDIQFLREVHDRMRTHPVPRIRAKYLATWDLYYQRYTAILDVLLKNGFEPEPICPTADWEPYKKVFSQSLAATQYVIGDLYEEKG
jgi:hypothetical protein